MAKKRKSNASDGDKDGSQSSQRRKVDQPSSECVPGAALYWKSTSDCVGRCNYCGRVNCVPQPICLKLLRQAWAHHGLSCRAHIQKGSQPLQIASSAQNGGPLCLMAAPVRESTQIPLAAEKTAIVRLSDLEDDSETLSCATFQAALAGDSGAPLYRPPPDAWLMAAQSITEAAGILGREAPLRVVVMGSRNMGKSTFCRLLINRMLDSHPCIAFLDTDLGQPEFTVPGLMSISMLVSPVFGPPHLHQRTPEWSHFLGDITPQNEPEMCIQAVRSLYGWYCTHAVRTDPDTGSRWWAPLVVNTHGWIQGFGLEMLEELLRVTAPTHAVTLHSSTARRNLPSHPFWLSPGAPLAQVPRMVELPGVGAGGAATESGTSQTPSKGPRQQESFARPLAAVDARGLSWLAFAWRCCGFRSALPGTDSAAYATAAQRLAAQPPFLVQFSDVKVQVLHSRVSAPLLAAALNCSVVGLATSGSGDGADESSDGSHASPGQQLFRCLGVGFVRAVDVSKGRLYVLTDLSPQQLEAVDVLQVGRLELPSALMQASELTSPYLRLWSISAEGSGAGVIKSRNNLPRLGQQ